MSRPPQLLALLPLIAALAAVSCSSDGDMMSGGDEAIPCAADVDCDDGLFCNGVERCEMDRCTAGTPPCTTACSESSRVCSSIVTFEVEGFTTTLGAGCFALGPPFASAGSSVAINTAPPALTIGQAFPGEIVSVQQEFRQDSTAAGGFGYSCTFAARVLADGVEIGSDGCVTSSAQGTLSCSATIQTTIP
jgi:hypothetical protein